MVASIAANIAAAHPSIGARIVDAWPAVALLLVVEMLARPPAPAAPEVPLVPAVGSPPPAEGAAQPPHPEVPAHVRPPAVLRPGTIPFPVAGEAHPPAPVSAVPRPYPAGIGQVRSPGQTASRLPHLHDQTATLVTPVPAPQQPASEVPPAARGGTPCDSGEVPPPQQVPAPQHVPPAATAAEIPAEAGPPQPVGSADEKRRNETVDTGGTRRRRSYHSSAGGGVRRPTAATLQLARQILDAEPDLPRTEVAARLGVSTRRLREVLATAA
jgi:hypothetical protein